MLLRIAQGRRQAGHRDGDHRRRARLPRHRAPRCATATPPAAPWASGSAPSAASPTSATCTRCPGHGTALVARFWPAPRPPRSAAPGWSGRSPGRPSAATSSARPRRQARLTGVLCDGLGHGPLAASAATEAVAAVLEDPAAEPAALVERAHRRIAHTRGGAIGVVQVAGQAVRFAGPRQHRGGDPGRRHPPEHALRAGDRGPPGPCHQAVRVHRPARRGDRPALRRHQRPLGRRGAARPERCGTRSSSPPRCSPRPARAATTRECWCSSHDRRACQPARPGPARRLRRAQARPRARRRARP